MLLGEDGRWAQENHLLIIDNRLEGGTDGDLGLAKFPTSPHKRSMGWVDSMSALTSFDGDFLVLGELVGEFVNQLFCAVAGAAIKEQ